MSVIAAGVDRNQLIRWMSIGISGLYRVYTPGPALLIEMTGA